MGELVFVALLFFGIALLYSSVGFGGGSSYLALLALFLSSFFVIRSTALLCNIVVVSGSCYLLFREGYFLFKKFLPFVLTSVPMAFIGAAFRLTERTFFILLGIALVLAAFLLILQTLLQRPAKTPKMYPKVLPYGLGAAVGLLSGLVGIGGGIFLAPILHYLKWDKPLVIGALSSFFILVNSISGLGGLVFADTFKILVPETVLLVLAVLLGGQIGTRLSIKSFSAKTIRLLTAGLVLLVGLRILLSNG
ncbi:sulfite exporter TauE/SafE family protein [Croceitalea dokdonensis]|nr:sulfite exporter TauE/SafE family protein [Croceitalea dokdonensis]